MPTMLKRCAIRPLRFIPDHSRSVISENDSPDVGFRYSLNPYRGLRAWLFVLLCAADT